VGVGAVGGGAPRVVTQVNADLLAQRRLGAVEEVWYESDSPIKSLFKVQGWILKPPDFDPSRKYPLILEIHGGPFANYGDRFDVEKQVWAGKGYVVLYTNPRGSTSYGEWFANLIHHAYPGDDYFDLVNGVDALIADGHVDRENLFVTGGSGGGVLTCWMIGRTDRFRAAASQYPVINWYSFTLTADLSVFFWKYWFPGLPWDHTQHYMDRSLTSVVKNVKTPTMVITGEEDWRTPISESEQYYKALKLLKVESVLVRVPGEPHGIRQRPSHHVAKMLNIVGWFDKHRTGATTPASGSVPDPSTSPQRE
jgi:acylaminoacyl-peptidase